MNVQYSHPHYLRPADREAVLALARQVYPEMGADPEIAELPFHLPRMVLPRIGEDFLFFRFTDHLLPDGRRVGLDYLKRGDVLAIECADIWQDYKTSAPG